MQLRSIFSVGAKTEHRVRSRFFLAANRALVFVRGVQDQFTCTYITCRMFNTLAMSNNRPI